MTQKKVKPKSPNRSYDWTAIAAEFISRGCSLEEFAAEKKIPYGTLTKRAADGNWLKQRKEIGKLAEKKFFEKTADCIADRLAEQNERDAAGAARMHEIIMSRLGGADGLETKDIRALASAMKDVQAVARLALGASTENANLNIDTDFESWLNARRFDE